MTVKPRRSWRVRMTIAMCGAAITFVALVLVNLLLVEVGFSVKNHPEVGSTKLTVLAIVLGTIGAIVGLLLDRNELSSAVAGTILMAYLTVVIGAAAHAFHNVHFDLTRLIAGPLFTAIAVSGAGASVAALVRRIREGRQQSSGQS